MNRCIAKPPKPQAPDFKAAATRAESTETSITCPFHTAWTRSGRSPPLLDNFVGAGEERLRHGEAERLGGLEVDDQLEGRRLLDRQIGGLGALEDLCRVSANQVKGSSEARSIADQAAGSDEFAPRIDRRNGMAQCQRHELLAPAAEERIGGDEKRVSMQLG